MNSLPLLFVVFVAGSVRCDVFYREQPRTTWTPFQPFGYYRSNGLENQFPGYGPVRAIKGYGAQDASSRGYTGDEREGDYYRGDVLRHEVHDAQDSGLKAVSGANGIHAVAVDTKGRQDYAGHSSARGLQAAGEAATGKVQEYGTSGNEGYNGFEKAGYKKGHSNSGFHKSYSNEESGKDSKFIDEDLKVGEETTGKSYGDKFGHSGKTGYGEEVKGFGYDHMTKGGGAARSGLDSNAKHDIIQGEHGHKGGYNNKDSFVRDYGAGAYHDGQQKAGQSYGTSDHVNTLYSKPKYY